jgi:hypothetical protein
MGAPRAANPTATEATSLDEAGARVDRDAVLHHALHVLVDAHAHLLVCLLTWVRVRVRVGVRVRVRVRARGRVRVILVCLLTLLLGVEHHLQRVVLVLGLAACRGEHVVRACVRAWSAPFVVPPRGVPPRGRAHGLPSPCPPSLTAVACSGKGQPTLCTYEGAALRRMSGEAGQRRRGEAGRGGAFQTRGGTAVPLLLWLLRRLRARAALAPAALARLAARAAAACARC